VKAGTMAPRCADETPDKTAAKRENCQTGTQMAWRDPGLRVRKDKQRKSRDCRVPIRPETSEELEALEQCVVQKIRS